MPTNNDVVSSEEEDLGENLALRKKLENIADVLTDSMYPESVRIKKALALIGTDSEETVSTAKYQLSGQVDTGWCDSEEAVLDEYNELVSRHNGRCKRESSFYARLDNLYGGGTAWETLTDGTVRYQWLNPASGSGMVYLEVRDEDEE